MSLDKIKKLAAEYDSVKHKALNAERKELTPRFKALVTSHGVSSVSAATGLSEATVVQYCRCQVIPVSKYAVEKAENILLLL